MAAIAQDYTQPEPFEVPEGGLASFLTATTGEWAEATNDSHIPETGIAGVKQVADKLAQYGRYEDEYMVHAAEGETVIPAQVLDLNPRLKAKLFKEMRDMGLEPERYVVGSELNSINPVTGQPEFFIKKLFKSVKKAVKKVVKVFKKIAPVVLPFALNAVFPGMGTVLQGAIGSGLGTAIQGGNLKDVLKAAAVGGAAGYIGGKITGAENIGPGENPFELNPRFTGGTPPISEQEILNIEPTDFSAPTPPSPPSGALPPVGVGQEAARLAEFEAVQDAYAAGQSSINPSLAADPTQRMLGQLTESSQQLRNLGIDPSITGASPQQLADLGITSGTPTQATSQVGTQASADLVAPTSTQQAINRGFGSGTLENTTGFFSSLGEGFSNLTQGNFSAFLDNMSQAFLPENYTAENLRAEFSKQFGPKALSESNIDFGKLASELASESGPNLARRYLPAAVGITGLMGAAGGFETPEVQPLPDPYGGATGLSLLEQNRAMYAPGVFRYAANGGDVAFPRMNGAISGPGTETSDDIPAMLSDGEFVMTARAVRGAGNGDREAGMRRMYEIMNRFEGGAIRGS